jgi:hypothetical protein
VKHPEDPHTHTHGLAFVAANGSVSPPFGTIDVYCPHHASDALVKQSIVLGLRRLADLLTATMTPEQRAELDEVLRMIHPERN